MVLLLYVNKYFMWAAQERECDEVMVIMGVGGVGWTASVKLNLQLFGGSSVSS